MSRIKNEDIDILLKSLRDNNNKPLFPKIIRSLELAGLSKEIRYFLKTGLRFSDSDVKRRNFLRELDEIGEEYKKVTSVGIPKKKINLKYVIAVAIFLWIVSCVIFYGLISSLNHTDSTLKNIPFVTEQSPVKQGDKL